MFLRSLTLKGFKSFAEPTTLEFEPGVTAVVGPNGSGKSNVVDAVAWVLGAQGPRTVRSGRMDDVIFAGSAARPALGRAEVSLTIDNSAGLLPIQLSEVTLTRTLFRSSGESEYAINGVPCRLLDVAELLSDTGVGRQQHVIVSQGQLDAVLDARSEDRRLIVEEAAGILKFRRRKEKAQRRLDTTEANLLRLTDLLREVARQMKPLERQAEAARRHESLVGELAALRLHLAGRELAALGARARAAVEAGTARAGEEAEVRAELSRLDATVAAAEEWLSRAEHGSVSAVVARLEALRERARGMGALLDERGRHMEERLRLSLASDQVAALQAEATSLVGQLAEADAQWAELGRRQDELAAEESALEASRARLGPPPGSGAGAVRRAGEARGELAALRSVVAGRQEELARLERAAAALQVRSSGLAERAADFSVRAEEVAGRRAAAEAALAEATAAHEAALARLASAEASVARADASLRAERARAEALALGDDETAPGEGAALLGRAGVLGVLGELVEVEPGWALAVEAVAAEVLRAVVVDGAEAAQRALAALEGSGPSPLLAVLGARPPEREQPAVTPEGSRPVRSLVTSAHGEVEHLLDHLLAGAVAVEGSWADAARLAGAFSGLVVVTRAGDRFSASTWRRGGRGPEARRAARAELETRLARAGDELATSTATLSAARSQVEEASSRYARCKAEMESAAAAVAGTGDESERMAAELAGAAAEEQALTAERSRLVHRLEADSVRLRELEATLALLAAEERGEEDRVSTFRAARLEIEMREERLRSARADLRVTAASVGERRRAVAARHDEVESRLADLAAEVTAARERAGELTLALDRTRRLSALLGERAAVLDADLTEISARRDRLATAVAEVAARLESERRLRQAAERRLEEIREHRRRAELAASEARLRLETCVERVRQELDCEPEAAMAAVCPPLPEDRSAADRRREVERELRLLGPVNPLAVEELAALSERHDFLSSQLDDVRSTRRDLAKVIREVEAEMSTVLAAAYADVADNFARLFQTLFPGGQGRLRLSDPDHLLDTGIEIEARPAGKNVRRLSLLSGGERSLVALAFLFAVFRSRPSPFYLLDEVEAALDDVNLHRFLALLDDLRDEAQLLVVTHQKRTMEAADCLYGVTMAPGGSTRVVSERTRARHLA